MRTDASIQQIIDAAQNNDDIIEEIDDLVTTGTAEIGSAVTDFFTPIQNKVTEWNGRMHDVGYY